MRDSFYQRKKAFYVRFTAMICILGIIMSAFFAKITELQVVNAEEYLAQADTSSTRTLTVTATRGEVVDRYGRSLIYNRNGFNIEFDAAYLPSSNLNSTISRLVELLKNTGDEWVDRLPMSAEAPYTFAEDAESDISALRTTLGLAHYATAENCFDAMVTRYKLEGMTESEQRIIMGVRYSMERADYSIAAPFCFAEDVSDNTVTVLKESSFDYKGVNIVNATFREYADASLAPHILGYTGLMSADEWANVKDSGQYQFNDKIGKAGVEKAFEEYLRGTDGKIRITQSASGEVTDTSVIQEAVSGNTVQLTIDRELQKVAQAALSSAINKINASAVSSSQLSTGGAVVVLEVNTGEILACANYPTYSLDEFFSDYNSLLTAQNNPLFDRALNGSYPPGSTFKPAIALIGLEQNKIGVYDTIRCVHKYTRFSDYQPTCLGYHGSLNVTTALAKSCNFFFYELGYRIGIADMNKYCRQFGLGVPTGVELPEYKGVLAGKEAREAAGGIWNPGDTIQAAIGQSDNAFTPMQMAVYTATIATGGTRYKAHYLKSIYDYGVTTLIDDDFTVALDEVEISAESFSSVKQGMLQVTETGTATATFGNYPIKVAGKTGTADAYNKTNAMFIAFAPYDDPQIAIAIAVENGGHGSAIAPVAKEVFDAYFFTSDEPYSEQDINTLLK